MGMPVKRMTHLAARLGLAAATTAALLCLVLVKAQAVSQAPGGDSGPAKGKTGTPGKDQAGSPPAAVKLGLSINDPGAFRGYTLLEPHGQEDGVLDRHGRACRQDLGDPAQLDASRVPARGRPSVPGRECR